jgi:hypothetical protein
MVNRSVTAKLGVAGLKALLQILGLNGGHCRGPLLGLNQVEEQSLLEELKISGLVDPHSFARVSITQLCMSNSWSSAEHLV